MPNETPDQTDKPVLTIIQRLKDKSLSPEALTKTERQQCVEALLFEGYSSSQIAQLVDRNEKTIKRDLVYIRQRNALTPSPDLSRQLIGNFLIKVEAHQTRLMRLARGSDGSVGERAQAEYSAWRVLKESMELLQTLGYLPLKPQQVVGNVIHYLSSEAGESSLERTEETILEIETVAKDTGTLTPELTNHIQVLQRRLEQAKLNQEAQRLLEQQRQTPEERQAPDVG